MVSLQNVRYYWNSLPVQAAHCIYPRAYACACLSTFFHGNIENLTFVDEIEVIQVIQ
jgi:hypothetical protein